MAQTRDRATQRAADRLEREGIALTNKERPAEAIPLLEKSLALYLEAVGERDRRVVALLGRLSYANYKLARYKESLAFDERRLKLSLEFFGEKHPDSIQGLRDVAIAYENVYDDGYARALPLLERALPLRIEERGERDLWTRSLMVDLANAYSFLGRYSEALALYERQARIVAEEFGADDERALQALGVVAYAYRELGRNDEALPIIEKNYRLTLKKEGERSRGAAFAMVSLGSVYNSVGRAKEALPLLEGAVELRKTVFKEKDRETIHFLEALGGVYMKLGRAGDALPLFEQALKLNIEDAGDTGERSFVALRSLAALAGANEALGRHEEARALHEKALRLRTEVQGAGHPDTLDSLHQLARAEERLGRAREAAAHYARLVPAVEALRASGDLSPENRQALFAQWVGAYKSYARLLAAEGRAPESFRMAELSKARTLLESTAMRRANQSSVLVPAERDRVRAVEGTIAGLNDRIAAAGSPERRFALEADKNRAVAELAQLRRALVARYPKYAQLSEVRIVDAEGGRAALPDGAVLISYLLDGERAVAFALSAEGLAARVLEGMSDLAEKIEAYRRLISDPERLDRAAEANALAADLGARLLQPLAGQLAGKRRVVVSPDGALALLPFETLPLQGKPLIAQADVSYTQSASMMALLKEREPRSGERKALLAMGGAQYAVTKKNQPRAAGADLARMLSRGAADPFAVQRAFDALAIEWPELPGSEQEVESVARLFGERGAVVYTRRDATEEKLLQLNASGELARFRYLLFSAHGYLSTEEPALSALVLGQVAKAPGTDGYVTAGEWPGYDLASDLVVLSACDTGVGRVVQGEGVTGLPYALYVAGNRNTLLSLWPVVDQSTAIFMTAFFARLKGGEPQAAALSETKREFIGGREFDRPLFWAPFVLYGE